VCCALVCECLCSAVHVSACAQTCIFEPVNLSAYAHFCSFLASEPTRAFILAFLASINEPCASIGDCLYQCLLFVCNVMHTGMFSMGSPSHSTQPCAHACLNSRLISNPVKRPGAAPPSQQWRGPGSSFSRPVPAWLSRLLGAAAAAAAAGPPRAAAPAAASLTAWQHVGRWQSRRHEMVERRA